ncbi:hypothetical protein ACFZAG_26710 [Streptomyces sp. NPDC012403]|uniref:hypothetical protein n=1 Tax=Streptomyces TaxID=1883 RepID=UPI003488C32A
MAEPDNIARLIAAGSALGTACNMAVSYATYRRKRPRFTFCCTYDDAVHTVLSPDGRDLVPEPMYGVHLRNLGETPIRVLTVRIEAGPVLARWWQRWRYRLSRGRSWKCRHSRPLTLLHLGGFGDELYEETPVPEDGHLTLQAFEQVEASYVLRNRYEPPAYPNWLQLMERDEVARLSVELPGGQRLHGPLFKPVRHGPSPRKRDEQMTFDDLMGTG